MENSPSCDHDMDVPRLLHLRHSPVPYQAWHCHNGIVVVDHAPGVRHQCIEGICKAAVADARAAIVVENEARALAARPAAARTMADEQVGE